MNINNRVTEITESMQALRKNEYYREETLQGLSDLQDEIVNLTFAEGHAEKMKLPNVIQHFEDLNLECGHIAEKELQRFKRGCVQISGYIAKVFSGAQGEERVFRTLETLKTKHILLRNMELGHENNHAEIDAIVITSKAIFHIEVKNYEQDTIIDAKGNLYQTNNHNLFYCNCNLGERLRNNSHLISTIVNDPGYVDAEKMQGTPIIKGYAVSANAKATFENHFPFIESCYFTLLPYIIDAFEGEDIYSQTDMDLIARSIRAAECRRAYPLDLDVDQFRCDFATLMATLEAAKKLKNVVEHEKTATLPTEEANVKKRSPTAAKKRFNLWDVVRNSQVTKYAGCLLLGIAGGWLVSNTAGKYLEL